MALISVMLTVLQNYTHAIIANLSRRGFGGIFGGVGLGIVFSEVEALEEPILLR
jgi:uncharacterized membrane-anchored protein YitT (DUF2179 family)